MNVKHASCWLPASTIWWDFVQKNTYTNSAECKKLPFRSNQHRSAYQRGQGVSLQLSGLWLLRGLPSSPGWPVPRTASGRGWSRIERSCQIAWAAWAVPPLRSCCRTTGCSLPTESCRHVLLAGVSVAAMPSLHPSPITKLHFNCLLSCFIFLANRRCAIENTKL